MIDAKDVAAKAVTYLRWLHDGGYSIQEQLCLIKLMANMLEMKEAQIKAMMASNAGNVQIVDAMPIPTDEVFRQ